MGIVTRLEAINRQHPRQDKKAVEAAVARHCKSLGLYPLPVVLYTSLIEALDDVTSSPGNYNLTWDDFEYRITGSRACRGPQPLETVPLEFLQLQVDDPFDRARNAAWTLEETEVLKLGFPGYNWEILDLATPPRSATLTAALATRQTPEVLREPFPLLTMLDAAEAGLWLFWVRRNDIVALLRPAIHFRGDRLHRDDGPALLWADGTPWHYWHGVRVPEQAVERPETITLDGIRAEKNAEVRRVLIERYGAARYLLDIGAQPAHEDRCGTLFTVPQPDDEPLTIVRVLNSTPEPDGTVKTYYLRVPPEIRTATQAVAWTFGLREHEYRPQIET